MDSATQSSAYAREAKKAKLALLPGCASLKKDCCIFLADGWVLIRAAAPAIEQTTGLLMYPGHSVQLSGSRMADNF